VLLEWSGATPVVVNSASAQRIQPATPAATYTVTPTGTPPPQSADASGTFYCGYSGDNIIIGGALTDNVTTAGTTYNVTGSIGIGDSARITLDGASDGLADVGGDDHDLYIAPNGRVLDFDTTPISVTVATRQGASGWTFELLLDSATLEIDDLASGIRWGTVFHVYDADDATGIQHILTDRKRWLTIP
jgi:hypothetical protein